MTIGVLLPLRLETRFNGTQLRLRIIPDEPWFDRHDPLPTALELDDLERFLTIVDDEPLGARTTPAVRAAWEEFATRHGPGRATWLVRTFPESGERGPDGRRLVRRPPVLQEETRFAQIHEDFPDELQVWIARGGGAPALAATLPIRHDRLSLDPPDPNLPDDRRWWTSWPEALSAGLAVEIELGDAGNDIDALYVVGLGDADPAALFARHRDAGQLGLVEPGTPTNAVDGRPAADLGTDLTKWLRLLGRTRGADSVRQLSRALTGDALVLGPMPGEYPPRRYWTRELVAGLWPALWGSALSDALGLGNLVEYVAAWAADNVEPLGPLPVLRVGSQPYGVLPTTSLSLWRAAEGDPVVEAVLRGHLIDLRGRWARAAEAARGTVEGTDADGLVDLLAHPPISPGYAVRTLHPMELWLLSLIATGHRMNWRPLLDRWQEAVPTSLTLGIRPKRRYSARGWTRRVRLPMVTPAALPEGETVRDVLLALITLAGTQPATFVSTAAVRAALARSTASLLLRLAIRSLQVAIGDVGRAKLDIRPPKLEPFAAPTDQPTELSKWISEVTPDDLAAPEGPAVAYRRVIDGLTNLALGRSPGAADRGLPLEPMEAMLAATIDCATHRIDAWVSGPARRRLRDQQRARERCRLGAYGWVDQPRPGRPGPTPGGLLHAPSDVQALTAALLRDRAVNDPEPARWHMDIASAATRDAARLAEEVRRGAHPAEALGREVERAIGDATLIYPLRRRYPIRGAHAGRRVVDGQRVLAEDPRTLDLPPAARAALEPLRAVVDVYADLLVAEAVHHVVEGRAATAGAALDAAAGLARPPDLEVLRTRREGRAVETTCVIALPDVPLPDLPADPDALAAVRPARIADPAAAALLRERLGGGGDWRWQVAHAGGEPVTITLAELGLEPAEALALGLGDLERLVLAAAPGAAEFAGRDGSARYERAVRLTALLGRTPVVTEDLGFTTEVAEVAAELLGRYTRLRTVAAALADRLAAATTPDQRGAALRLASRWGLASAPDPALHNPLAGQVERADVLLRARLAAGPDPEAAATLDPLGLTRAIADLASPTGQIAVLGRLRRDAFPTLEVAGPGTPGGGLDTVWLPFIAPVREQLARLEAAQLAGPALVPWTNRRADPWQTNAADARRMVAAYAPSGLDLGTVPPGATLAVALLDRFAEFIPDAEHSTAAAFGFDAPGARAQQAILLAIPPDLSQPLDVPTLVEIVAETRELARARMATLADLDDVTALMPLPLIPLHGDTAVRIDAP
jgi:hypothetical protein